MEIASREPNMDLIREPPPSTRIWKYLDLAKFLALLRYRCLHLAPTTEFSDRFEGDIGSVQRKKVIDRYGEEKFEQIRDFLRRLRERTFVSCWTENEFESDAMWRIYTGASYGVALQSTYERLKNLLPSDAGNLTCTAGRVNYVDYNTEILNLESYFHPYFYKRKSFEHEREVRILLQEKAGGPSSEAQKIELDRRQLNELIESLHLSPGAPNWFRVLVRDICRDYGLDLEPIRSALDEEPS